MSAKNRGTRSNGNDFYETPLDTLNSLLSILDLSKVKTFREPCKGNGAIYNNIEVPNKDYCELTEGVDYLTTKLPEVDLIITNPPFSLAKEFITKALTESNTVIMLQRVNYLGSKERKDFWNANLPTHMLVLSSRPKFIAKCNKGSKCTNKTNYPIGTTINCPICGSSIGPKSDSTEYAWFVWTNTNSIVKLPKGIHIL